MSGTTEGGGTTSKTGSKQAALDARILKRDTYITSIDRAILRCDEPAFREFSAAVLNDSMASALRSFERFETEHMAILSEATLSSAQFLAQNQIFAQTEQKLNTLRAKLQNRITELAPEVQAQAQPQAVRVEINAAELAQGQNTWGKFNGNLFKWQSFRDKFSAAVHTNDNMKPVFKLQHLLASLEGSAAGVVGTREPTDAGYDGAWDRLCEVYNDDYMIIRAILRTIFSIPALEQPTRDGLRKLVDTIHEACRQLTTLGILVIAWDQILVYMVTERLDAHTLDEWEMQRAAGLPTLQELCAFLERKSRSLAHVRKKQPKMNNKRKSGNDRVGHDHMLAKHRATSAFVPSQRSETNGRVACICCKGDHQLYRCADFMGRTLGHRQNSVARWKLCPNCLRAGHEVSKCSFGPCLKCKTKHNSALCPERNAEKAAANLVSTSASGKSVQKQRKVDKVV